MSDEVSDEVSDRIRELAPQSALPAPGHISEPEFDAMVETIRHDLEQRQTARPADNALPALNAEPHASVLQSARAHLEQVPNWYRSWTLLWRQLWQEQPGDELLLELARTWIASAPVEHDAWTLIWRALWQQPTADKDLVKLAHTWLAAVTPGHGGWGFVWQALWKRRTGDETLVQLACTWLADAPPGHSSWKFVWRALWRRLPGDEQLIALATTWLASAVPKHHTRTHVLKALHRERVKRLREGDVVEGTVKGIKDYGVFVELDGGIDGMVHISEISWTERLKHPSSRVKRGEVIKAVIILVDATRRRVSLSIKRLEPNPYELIVARYPPGSTFTGRVQTVKDYGVFVKIGQGIDGLLHVHDMAWTRFVRHPSRLMQQGDEVKVVVLDVNRGGDRGGGRGGDHEMPRIALGIRQQIINPWPRIPREYHPGKIVDAKVLDVLEIGVVLELEPYVEGLARPPETTGESTAASMAARRAALTPGQQVKTRILELDIRERRISLSIESAGHDMAGS